MAEPIRVTGSGILSSMTRADGFVVVLRMWRVLGKEQAWKLSFINYHSNIRKASRYTSIFYYFLTILQDAPDCPPDREPVEHVQVTPSMEVAQRNKRVKVEHKRDNNDEAEVAGRRTDHKCQPALGAGKKRVNRQPPIALLYSMLDCTIFGLEKWAFNWVMNLIINGALMVGNWWDELKGKDRLLYEEFRREMIKEKGDRFPEECSPPELTRLFEEWKKIRKR